MQQVWADAFVEEANLAQNVATLRKALGETPPDRQFIETVSKHGYRFVAPVRRLGDEPAAPEEIPGEEPAESRLQAGLPAPLAVAKSRMSKLAAPEEIPGEEPAESRLQAG